MHPCTTTATRHTQHAPRPSYQHSQHALPLQARGGRWQVFTVSTLANRGLFITPDFPLTLSCAGLGDVVPDLSKPDGALLDELSQTQVMLLTQAELSLHSDSLCHWPVAQADSSSTFFHLILYNGWSFMKVCMHVCMCVKVKTDCNRLTVTLTGLHQDSYSTIVQRSLTLQ